MSDYKLIGYETYLEKLVTLYKNNQLPNKILLLVKKVLENPYLLKNFYIKFLILITIMN